jgi:hypothetical protein
MTQKEYILATVKDLCADFLYYDRKEDEDLTDRKTRFAKTTNDLFSEVYLFEKLDKSIPGGIYGTGGVSGFGFGTKPFRRLWKSDEANAIRPTLQALVNKILKRTSGAAVTDQEFDRMETALGINTTGTVEEFRLGLQNYYETAKGELDRFVAADPEAASGVDKPKEAKTVVPSKFKANLTQEQRQLVAWAKKNPSDPRAATIFTAYGEK